MRQKKDGGLRRLLSQSLFLTALFGLADRLHRMALTSVAGAVISTEPSADSSDRGVFGHIAHWIYIRILRPIRRFFIRSFDRSAVLRLTERMLRSLLSCTMRVWSAFFLSMALFGTLVWILRGFVVHSITPALGDLYLLVAVAVMALLVRISHATLAEAVTGSAILSFLLFNAAGVRREAFEAEVTPRTRGTGAFVLGMVAGLLTWFIPLPLLLLGMAAAIVLYVILIAPESGVVLIFFAVPFLTVLPHPSLLAAGMVLYVGFCYLLKLLRGKRAFRFEMVDGAVLLFLCMVAAGGVITVSPETSRRAALLYTCFIIGYFLVANLIRTEIWIKRCVLSLCTSSALVSLYGIYQYVTGNVNTTWQDEEMFSDISGRVVSLFGNPNVLAEYLLMTIPFAVALLFMARRPLPRLAAAVVSAAGLVCLVVTWSRGAWIGFCFGILIFALIFSHRTVLLLIIGVAAVPFLPLILPESIVARFASIGNLADSSTAYRFHIWQSALSMIRDFFSCGLGTGIGAFQKAYPAYSRAGIESAPHSHNFYFEMMIELGIFGLLAFAAILFFMIRKALAYVRSVPREARPESHTLLAAAGLAGIGAVLVQGMTDYIWYNYRVFLMMWLVIGLTVAIARFGKGRPMENLFVSDYDRDMLDFTVLRRRKHTGDSDRTKGVNTK